MSTSFDGVIDLSHHNTVTSFTDAASSVSAVVHKATQGLTFRDPTYVDRRSQAVDSGLLWGAYHFGDGSDGVEQADHFLGSVNIGKDLLVLDLEANPTGPTMPLSEAHAFVTRVFQKTGHYPGLYAGHYLKELIGAGLDPVLANCWLWIAQYSAAPVIPPNWTDWTMWQYTDGALGPRHVPVPGVSACDRDMFNGEAVTLTSDATGLTAFWTSQLG
jgi:lysozyme